MILGKVYMIISPSTRIYVGSTKQKIESRWWYYHSLSCKSQPLLYNSLKKYGSKSHKFYEVWSGDIEKMYKMEAIIGIFFNLLNPKYGLNCSLPKISEKYQSVSLETKLKIGLSSKNRSLESRNKSKESAKNRSIEVYKKISKTLKGKKHTAERIKKTAEAHYKPIIQMDMDSNFIKEWESSLQVSVELKINQKSIRRCCIGGRASTGNFKWKYK